MKIGAMDNVLQKPWHELFDAAACLGFDGVELDLRAATYLDSDVWSAAGRKSLKERSARAGVEIASVCMADVAGLMVKPDTYAQGIRALADLRRFCDELGAGVILFPMIPGSDETETFDSWVKGFQAAFTQSAGCQARVGMESVGRAGCSAERMLAVMQAVGSSYLGTYYDVGNAAFQGFDNFEQIAQLGNRIFQVHMKEIRAEMGEGVLDFPALIAALEKIGYDGYLVLETNAGDDPAKNAARNLAFLRNLL